MIYLFIYFPLNGGLTLRSGLISHTILFMIKLKLYEDKIQNEHLVIYLFILTKVKVYNDTFLFHG